MKCKDCEHYILSQCPGGLSDNMEKPCFLENIYGVKAEKTAEFLGDAYKLANKLGIKGDKVLLDLQKNKTKSKYYPIYRAIVVSQTKYLLDMYHKLGVKLTLEDFRAESFYAGIPPVTADEINKYIDEVEKNE